MNRMRRIVIICAVGIGSFALVFVGCMSTPIDPWAEPADDIRVELVEWARFAQNAHNYQSWRVVLDPERGDRMWLYTETERLLPETDPPARQVTISHGTFLAVMEARAAQLGFEATINLFPRGEYDLNTIGELPVAEIVVRESPGFASPVAVAAQVDAITQPTIKYRYRPADLETGILQAIEGWSSPEDGIEVRVVTDLTDVDWLNDLSRQAYELEMRNPATRDETYTSTRMTRRARRRTPYGLAYTANFRPALLRVVEISQALFPQNQEAWAQTGIDQFSESLADINTYIVITSDTNDRTTQVHTGRILQAVWMDVQSEGHVVLANSQALQEYPEMSELYARVHERLAPRGETVQMLLAIARPAEGRHLHSPRLPVEALIHEP